MLISVNKSYNLSLIIVKIRCTTVVAAQELKTFGTVLEFETVQDDSGCERTVIRTPVRRSLVQMFLETPSELGYDTRQH